MDDSSRSLGSRVSTRGGRFWDGWRWIDPPTGTSMGADALVASEAGAAAGPGERGISVLGWLWAISASLVIFVLVVAALLGTLAWANGTPHGTGGEGAGDLGPAGLPCGVGRECIPTAGISLTLPQTWSSLPREDPGMLFAAGASLDSPFGLIIWPASSVLEGPQPRDLEGARAAITAAVTGSLGQVGGLVVDRVTLPIGPALRVRYTKLVNFIMNVGMIDWSFWYFVDGRLMEISFVEATGEEVPEVVGSYPIHVQAILDSLRVLDEASG